MDDDAVGCRPKVIGVGLSRTGTRSLATALRILGYRTAHFPFDQQTERDLWAETGPVRVLENSDAILDIPAAGFFERLDRWYPGARFIWTTREKEEWLPAMERHLDTMLATWPYLDEQLNRFTVRISEHVYGSLRFDRERYASAFDRHTERVESYFADRPDDLLRIRITEGDGWRPLCDFLGEPVPDRPFPHLA